MAYALYRWDFFGDGVKRVCSLTDNRVCVGQIPFLQTISRAILECEHRDLQKRLKHSQKVMDAHRRGKSIDSAANAVSTARALLEDDVGDQTWRVRGEDLYPVSMHFMLGTQGDTAKAQCGPYEWKWFAKHLDKVVAAFGIDHDESDYYLVVKE